MSMKSGPHMLMTLGIETSCDETALALIETRGSGETLEIRVLSSLVHSQAELHSAYGGVFPSLAKREHGKNLVPLLQKLFIEAGLAIGSQDTASRPLRPRPRSRPSPAGAGTPKGPLSQIAGSAFHGVTESFRNEVAPQNPDLFESFVNADFLKGDRPPIDRIAVTEGPGLEPTLWVGINFARMLSALWQTPLIPIDHMEGHILGSLLAGDAISGSWHKLARAPMPAIALLVSGGHTELVMVKSLGDYEVIGSTRDDAVGEAFDKTARLLGLPYPGGPHISELARLAKESQIDAPVNLPRPMIKSGDLDFSFAGLKTAVLYAVRAAEKDGDGRLSDDFKKGLAREFELAATDVLDAKLRSALEKTGAKSIVVGGGVSANGVLRERLGATAKEFGLPIFLPSRHVSGDNALMIALAGAIYSGHKKAETPGMIRARGTKRLGMD